MMESFVKIEVIVVWGRQIATVRQPLLVG